MNEIELLKQRIELLENFVKSLNLSDRYIFQKNIQIMDGRNVQLALGTGTKIGTAISQKLGFFNKTPIIQQSAITAPTGGGTVDSQARTAINSLITTLEDFGLIALN